MSAFGVAFIGNIFALAMFGVGLLIRGYSMPLLNIDINKIYVPHGMMIGAGLVALIQVIIMLTKRARAGRRGFSRLKGGLTRSEGDIRGLLKGLGLYWWRPPFWP